LLLDLKRREIKSEGKNDKVSEMGYLVASNFLDSWTASTKVRTASSCPSKLSAFFRRGGGSGGWWVSCLNGKILVIKG